MERAPIGTADRPLRVAIVGTGPAGFFAAQTLTRARDLHVCIDLVERLPTPFGLVRGGVAPDHANVKRISRRFARIAGDERVRFFGNVHVGRDVQIAELRSRYDAVIIATGAESSRRMRAPGEDLDGVSSATAFTFWYNGHPDYADLDFHLDRVERAVVVGNGNVALDAARILSLSDEALRETDIAPGALRALTDRAVQRIDVLGRRGPAQASFTAPEIRELGRKPGLCPRIDPGELALDPATLALQDRLGLDPRREKVLGELATLAAADPAPGRELHLRFRVGVQAFLGDADGRLRAVRLVRNELVEEDGRILAIPTGEPWEEPCELALTAVGYRGVPIKGLPFDDARGIVPNEAGRVQAAWGHKSLRGLYVTGWARRGPSGVIGTNKPDAESTVSAMLDDIAGQKAACEPAPDLAALLAERGVRVVDWAAWRRIDEAEQAAGAEEGRPRRKHTEWESLLAAAGV